MAKCASGAYHSLFLDSLGSVWSCGFNQFGAMGLDHTNTTSNTITTPQKIDNLPPIISVIAGAHFSLFIDADGIAWSCGAYEVVKNENFRNVPEQITNLPKIKSAIALGRSSIFLDCEGSVWTCGHNSKGQLGLGDTKRRKSAEKIQGLPAIKSIAGGWNHSLFLDCEGSVWTCGCNSNGQLGLGLVTKQKNKAEKIRGLPKIKSMAGGVNCSTFVDEQGNVWVCGANQKGELGMGHTTQINSPQKNNNLSGIVAVGGGDYNYSVFLDYTGSVFTCGSNQHGQLGLGDTEDRHAPQKVNTIPPMSCISSCNTAGRYLQILDWEGDRK